MTTAPTVERPRALAEISGTIVLVGAGKMGAAMLEAWLALGLDAKSVVVLEPKPSREIGALVARGLRLNPSITTAAEAAAIVIAVKPQVAPQVVPGLAPYVGARTVTLSIMAGRTLAFLEGALAQRAALVRAMPNTPAAIGRGITVAVPNVRVSQRQREIAHALLAATGAVEWIKDEALMDAVTAVSGSGPAYVFLLTEVLARSGAAVGLPADLAERLARATVAGSGELLNLSATDPATLRQNVTSPGGTTAAALDVLGGPEGLEALMRRAVAAATRRSRELAG
ncbi:MAG: pyrroline-5-carboxylate reductase [Alphaproteobacteria bacterium]|nr:pyrroline-5-carboxylate reductase [Alphaproteobacteria bacterium]